MKKYPIASSFRRASARLLDSILIIGISIFIFFLFFSFDSFNITFKSYLFFSFVSVIWLLLIIYFLIIPFFTKGRTLFIWVFNMRVLSINAIEYSISFKKKDNKKMSVVNSLFRRELFVWNLLCIINFLLGIVIFVLGDHEGLIFLKSIFYLNLGFNNVEGLNPYSIIFASLYSINFLIVFLIFINFCINSSKRNIIDVFSYTVTIFLKEIEKENEVKILAKNKIINYSLPSEILDSVFEEMDDLREKNDKKNNK